MATTSKGDLVVFGGSIPQGQQELSDTWLFSNETQEWKQLVFGQTSPRGRHSHRCVINENDEVVLFGGFSYATGFSADLWKLQIYGMSGTSSVTLEDVSSTETMITETLTNYVSESSLESTSVEGSSLIDLVGISTAELNNAQSSESISEEDSSLFDPGAGDSAIVLSPEQSDSTTRSTTATTAKEKTEQSLQGIFTVRNQLIASVAIFVSLIVFVGIWITRRNYRNDIETAKSTNIDSDTTSHSINDHSTTQGSNKTTTMAASNYGLSIPGYLLVTFQTSVRVIREIAKGGFGRVLLGEVMELNSLTSGTPVIIKELIVKNTELSQREIDAFYQEVSIMAYLGMHRNISKIYAFTEIPYAIIMKYYPVGSLDNWIRSTKFPKVVSQLFHFALDIANGIEHIHKKGFCHSDLKPQNILIDFDPARRSAVCVLTDFGITQVVSDKALLIHAFKPVNTNAASVIYAAPEALLKLRKKETIPLETLQKIDIYSYAIVFYELICRKRVTFKSK